MSCARANSVRASTTIKRSLAWCPWQTLAALTFLAASACTRVAGGDATSANARNPWTVPGLLRIATRQEPDNLNPVFGTQTVDVDVSMFWAAYLFDWSDRDEAIPELAVRVPTMANGDIAPSGLAITYHLRRGVRWQDGAPFGSDDVIYTWRQVLNPRNAVVTRENYADVSRIDKIDDLTFTVRLKHRNAGFVSNFFTLGTIPYCILPKHVLERYADLNRVPYNDLPIGTGPFRVASYEKGSAVHLVANDRYWRGPPRLRKVDFRIIPNDNTILTLLRTHEIDFYYRASETQAPNVQGIPGTRIVMTPFTRFADLGLNGSSFALHDVRVRRALAYATDRRALVQKVMHGVGQVGDSDQPSFLWAHDRNVRKYPFDPARAEALLDEAGWHRGPDGIRQKDGRPLRLGMVSYTGSSTVTESEAFIQQAWRAVGIDLTVKNFSSAQLYGTLATGGIEQSGKFDVSVEQWANGTDPDDSTLFACRMAPPAGWNIYHLCSAKFDAATMAAKEHYDRPTRKAAFDRMQEVVADELPIIVLWYNMEFDVVNTDFHGYQPARAVTPFWNTWEWSM